ncbi:PEP-CTERM sorting domain-containing protein [Desulfobacter postgatei]|uniref:PEP-CTERM sorting domain-containing protein n=1 Tax=Desulfobacter postgatei TaxID=2293 RepID=UPI00259B698B|nr:PEP-CTERM sorting domain-containing protein [uncultured Desulfobacter sp.]
MKKLIFLLLVVLGFSTSANALMFDPTGSGDTTNLVEITTWDWAPSSAIAVDANGVHTGDTFTLLTHGFLSLGYDSTNTPSFSPAFSGLGIEITFVAGFDERIVSEGFDPSTGLTSQNFDVVSSGNNFFEVYIDTTPDADSNLAGGSAGTGFNNDTLLFKGTVFGGYGSFSSNLNSNVVLDNNFDGDEASGDNDGSSANDPFLNDDQQNTVTGTGGTTIYSSVAFSDFNTAYFPLIDGNDLLWLILSTNTNNNLPFANVDPSNMYWDGTNYIQAELGAINGSPIYQGYDVIFQMDASTSEVGVVPEPATFLLFGVGLLCFARITRRKA